jgi:hypothetical protein
MKAAHLMVDIITVLCKFMIYPLCFPIKIQYVTNEFLSFTI